jgi:hypothetical protein
LALIIQHFLQADMDAEAGPASEPAIQTPAARSLAMPGAG